MTRAFPADDPSRVAEIRRAAAHAAREEGLDDTLTANAALVATEITTNLLKHAKDGEVFLSKLSERSHPGIEILAIDHGPGMGDITRCLADGYSSGNTSGTGLGAMARLSQEFDIYSQDGRGTAVVARIQNPDHPLASVGAVLKPISGEEVSGDSWAFREPKDSMVLVVADGLGHGSMAARASADALSSFRHRSDDAPAEVLRNIHGSLRGTRGAAVAVAQVDRRNSVVRYAGIGNIVGVVIGSSKPCMMISHNGTAGYQSPRFQEFSYPLPENALIIMHSDGLHTNWNIDDYPGLRRRHPSLIAGVLFREATRGRDDACIVVARTGDLS
jgi:anti-sigma regulatory factor (Ser/Thr protein kinase)